jgi:hypothetical protein
MVNYTFRNSKIEYSHGDAFVFNRGGDVLFDGGSFINGISDAGEIGGTFLRTGAVPGHNDGATMATMRNLRVELRNKNCRVLDISGWSASSHISLYDVNDTGHAFTSEGPLTTAAVFHAQGGAFPNVRAQNCQLGGYWQYLGAQTGAGRTVLDQCGFKNWQGGAGTVAGASTFLRSDQATFAPKYRYRDCTVADASN